MSLSQFVFNIGEVVVKKDECFWIFPSECLSDQKKICSPWFSCVGGKWCLVKLHIGESFMFRLWRKVRSNLPKYDHTIELSLKTKCNDLISVCGNINPEYGCELIFKYICACRCRITSNHIFSQNGLVKLFFVMQNERNTNNITVDLGDGEDSNEDEESSENDESNEDKEDSLIDEEDSSEESSDDESVNKSQIIEAKGIKRLAENFKQFFLDGRLTDAVLKVDSREFNVHKVVLAARSPVFASMFEHDLAEKNTNVVDIPDCTSESFEVFLLYLYSGSAEKLSISNVYNVYYAADKYHIDDLKEDCIEFMKKNLSIETFCDIIALSLHHGESKLQKAATEFFGKKIKKIIKTVQWQKYMKENSTHANELLIKALKA